MRNQVPLTKDLVLVGGGHAHALVLRMWGMAPLPGVRLTLIDPRPDAPYTGMLPGYVAGHYTADQIEIDLVRLARFAGARLVLGAAEALDPVAKTVTVDGRVICYDIASVDIGITGNLPAIPGFDRDGVPVKPFARFSAAWESYLAGPHGPVAVVGGGLGAVELALAMRHRLGPDPEIRLVGRSGLSDGGRALRKRLAVALAGAGVDVIRDVATGLADNRLQLASGREVPATFCIGAAGATPHPWLRDTGLPLVDGFVEVGPTLQVRGVEDLFAAGDCAHLSHAPRPKAGVYAVRAGRVLFHNLKARAAGQPLKRFDPQKRFLRLVSLGGRAAVAEKWSRLSFAPSGPVVWRWKDHIDRRFMRHLTELPPMSAEPTPAHLAQGAAEIMEAAPLCAGCGAKVGAGVLSDVLSGLSMPRRDDVVTGPGDDAAVLRMGDLRQVLTTDHLRAFVEDPALMARIAAQHALGDIRAMGGEAQSALAQITLPRASDRLQRRMLDEIMGAAADVFGAEGAPVLGGHTTMGAELTIGFSVTGLCRDEPVTIAGAQDGDALILTGRIGTGVLLAAEMQGIARGRDIAALWSSMAAGPGPVVTGLAGAHAMTDVTGFGLAGHLMAICRASGLGADLDLSAVPLFDGALRASEQGVRSSLYAANRANAPIFGADTPRTALLHDPQTAAGFLAAVPAKSALATLNRLSGLGIPAAQIGYMRAGPVGITLI